MVYVKKSGTCNNICEQNGHFVICMFKFITFNGVQFTTNITKFEYHSFQITKINKPMYERYFFNLQWGIK